MAFWHTHTFGVDITGAPCLHYYGFSQQDIDTATNLNKPIFCHHAGGELLLFEPANNVLNQYTQFVGFPFPRDSNLDRYISMKGISETVVKNDLKDHLSREVSVYGPDTGNKFWNQINIRML